MRSRDRNTYCTLLPKFPAKLAKTSHSEFRWDSSLLLSIFISFRSKIYAIQTFQSDEMGLISTKNKNQELFHPDIHRIASCEFDIFPHLKDKLTSVPLTGVLKDRLRETPGRVNYSVYRLRTRTHSVCAQFLYILT